MKSILFLTTSNLTTNPRLLKELEFLNDDYNCTFYGFHLSNWSDKYEAKQTDKFPFVTFRYLSAGRSPFVPWLLSTMAEKIARLLYRAGSRKLEILAYGSQKRSFLLKRALRKDPEHYDFIISHTLGALYPAYWLASKRKIKFAFDLEDYHPYEKIENDPKNEMERRAQLLGSIFPNAYYVSYASELIGKALKNQINVEETEKYFLVRNAFGQEEFYEPIAQHGKVKLIWFSQNINKGRGLEDIVPVLDAFGNEIECHIIGANSNPEFVSRLDFRSYIQIHSPMSQKELHKILRNFDVGLAIEPRYVDGNKDICLSNKIFAYAQAGLFIIATHTLGQSQFMKEIPETGIVLNKNPGNWENSIASVIQNIDQIREHSSRRWKKAKGLDWKVDGVEIKTKIDEIFRE